MPFVRQRPDLEECYVPEPNSGCWLWEWGTTTAGYGSYGIPGTRKTRYAHREMFERTHGYAPKVVRHLCHNPTCVNPDHLVGGTQTDNMHDLSRKEGRTVITDEIVGRIRNHTGNQTALARELGIAQSTVSRIKRGLRRV